MLKTTPEINYKDVWASTETKKIESCSISGYRDFPQGNENQRFNFTVKDFDDALNFLEKCRNKGQKIRVAFFTNENGLNLKIPNAGLLPT